MKNLNHKQMAGLRYYDPEDEYVTSPPHPATRTSLELRGLICYDTKTRQVVLSPRGQKLVRDYVADSGNGPEDLKARFSFLGAR
jgi:hypothetical protein